MLVLTRHTNQKIRLYIGDKLLGEVCYLGNTSPDNARLGFTFGSEIRIARAEVDWADEQARKDA